MIEKQDEKGLESHIAILVPNEKVKIILPEFLSLNPTYLNKFLTTVNYSEDIVTPDAAIGHDLPQNRNGTYLMLTFAHPSLDKILKDLHSSIGIVKHYGLPVNNFEIEQFNPKGRSAYKDLFRYFPDYRPADESPKTEFHFQLEGEIEKLPHNEELVDFFRNLGIGVNQIVDFSQDIKRVEYLESETSRIYKVGTSFQPNIGKLNTAYNKVVMANGKYNFKLTKERILAIGVPR